MKKHTFDELGWMTDAALNAILAMLLGLKLLPDEDPLHNETAVVYHNGCTAEEYAGTNVDYVNNPNDIFHLAFKHKVGCIPCGYNELWKARDADAEFEVFDVRPLRAITRCLILVLQNKVPE